MKRLILVCTVWMAGVLITTSSRAQVNIGINVNIGSQPAWGPAGYSHVEYYYLPDIETYYYVPRGMFVYRSADRWMYSPVLPSRYSDYDLYSGYKVVINKRQAYRYFDDHRDRYARYKGQFGKQRYKGHSGSYQNFDRGYKGRGKKRGHWQYRGRD